MPLLSELNIDRYDGLIAAYLPVLVEDNMVEYIVDGGVLFAYEGCAIDILPGRVKWWRVRAAARQWRLAQIEPIWHGCAENFDLRHLPDVPEMFGAQFSTPAGLHVRAYSHGPWINIEPFRKAE